MTERGFRHGQDLLKHPSRIAIAGRWGSYQPIIEGAVTQSSFAQVLRQRAFRNNISSASPPFFHYKQLPLDFHGFRVVKRRHGLRHGARKQNVIGIQKTYKVSGARRESSIER